MHTRMNTKAQKFALQRLVTEIYNTTPLIGENLTPQIDDAEQFLKNCSRAITLVELIVDEFNYCSSSDEYYSLDPLRVAMDFLMMLEDWGVLVGRVNSDEGLTKLRVIHTFDEVWGIAEPTTNDDFGFRADITKLLNVTADTLIKVSKNNSKAMRPSLMVCDDDFELKSFWQLGNQ